MFVLVVQALAAPVQVRVTEPPWAAVVPGARVALLVSAGAGEGRRTQTWLATCAEVVAMVSGPTVRLELDASQAARVAEIPADAAVRLALCDSAVDPLSRSLGPERWAFPLPPSVPTGLAGWLRAGDHVEVTASLPPGSTVTLLRGVEVARDSWGAVETDTPPLAAADRGRIALAAPPADVEKLAHALDVGQVFLGLEGAAGEGVPVPEVEVLLGGHPGPRDRLSAIAPRGMRVFGIARATLGLRPFDEAGGYVDVVSELDGKDALAVQAAFLMKSEASDPATTLLLLTTAQAEVVAHAVSFGRVGFVLRNDNDVTFVEDPLGAPPAPKAAPAPEPYLARTRIGLGARGLVLPITGSAPGEGQPVRLVATGCPAPPAVGALRVVAVEGTSALVQGTTADALRIMGAVAACERVAVAR